MTHSENAHGAAVSDNHSHPDGLPQTVDDPRVIEHLEEYIKALEEGGSPDRQQLLDGHPQIAAELSACLDALELVHQVGPQLDGQPLSADGTTAASGDIRPAAALGDFRILREVGRGGMGVVYEAQQVSLGRRVALKVLPFAAVLDPKQLQRFKNEAQAAASLKHPNIVGIHSVGCERGVHYYAMEYVEGQTLAQVIRQLPGARDQESGSREARSDRIHAVPTGPDESGHYEPSEQPSDSPPHPVTPSPLHSVTPSPRHDAETSPLAALSTEGSPRSPEFFHSVARLGIQAAEALEHAHGMGVVHRDIKPSNLMVALPLPSPSGRGAGGEGPHLWITDFGLAMTQTDANLTMTGDLLGTLRYMSPEQVQAKHGVLDHRTDVYSLGLTLYELLTLQPAFPGDDRQKLLRQVAEDDPRPPRQVNSAIAKDLETIVLKATAKEPQSRYATAQQLADDLGRFLEDKPIRAKRPSLAQRATKWSRRHRPVVWSAAVALVVAVIGLAISTVVILGKEAETQRALQRAKENEARAKVEAAKANAVVDLMQQMLASANPVEVKGADYTVRQLLDDFSANLDDQLEDQPEVEAAIRATIGKAYRRLDMLDRAESHLKTSLELRRQVFGEEHPKVAESLLDYAWILNDKGNADQAEVLARKALAISRKQANQTEAMLTALRLLQQFLTNQRRYAESDTVAAEALAIAGEERAEEYPIVADILHSLARSQRWQGNLAKAEALARNALAIHRKVHGSQHPETGWCLNELATVLQYQGNYAEAEAACREAMAIFRKQVGGENLWLGGFVRKLGSILQAQGDHAGAEALFREALAIYQKLVAEFPDNTTYHRQLAESTTALINLLKSTGRKDASFREALAIYQMYQKLVAEFPDNTTYQRQLEESTTALIHLLKSTGRKDEAQQILRDVIPPNPRTAPEYILRAKLSEELREYDKALADRSKAIELDPSWARAHFERGALYLEKFREYEKALADLDKSLQLDPSPWYAYKRRALAHFKLGHYDKALADIAKAVEMKPDDTSNVTWISPSLVAKCPDKPFRDGILKLADKTIELTNGSAEAYAARGALYAGLGQHHTALADFEKAMVLGSENPGLYNKAAWSIVRFPGGNAELVERAVKLAEKAVELAPKKGHIWNTLGVAQYRAGDWDAAIDALQKSLELQSDNSFTFFFLAMAHWQLGEKDEARKWYDKAVEWMDKNKPDDEELRRFCAEAAELLGATDTPSEAKEKTDQSTTKGAAAPGKGPAKAEPDGNKPSSP